MIYLIVGRDGCGARRLGDVLENVHGIEGVRYEKPTGKIVDDVIEMMHNKNFILVEPHEINMLTTNIPDKSFTIIYLDAVDEYRTTTRNISIERLEAFKKTETNYDEFEEAIKNTLKRAATLSNNVYGCRWCTISSDKDIDNLAEEIKNSINLQATMINITKTAMNHDLLHTKETDGNVKISIWHKDDDAEKFISVEQFADYISFDDEGLAIIMKQLLGLPTGLDKFFKELADKQPELACNTKE